MEFLSKIDDKYIINFFYKKNGKINCTKLNLKHLNDYPEIKKYLENRFPKNEWISYYNVIKRIKNKIFVLPKCPTCGKVILKYEHKYCSDICASKDPFKLKATQERRKNKIIQKYKITEKINDEIFLKYFPKLHTNFKVYLEINPKLKQFLKHRFKFKYFKFENLKCSDFKNLIEIDLSIKEKINLQNKRYIFRTWDLYYDSLNKIEDKHIILYFGRSKNGKNPGHNGNGLENISKFHNKNIEKYIRNRYKPFVSYYLSIDNVLNKRNDYKRCLECGSIINDPNRHDFCSLKCKNKSNLVKNKTKNTNLERYGTDVTFKNEYIKNKCKETKLRKYNNPYFVNSKKAQSTKEKRYGDKNYTNKEKAKKTNLERYGCEHHWDNKEIRNKAEETLNKKFGVKSDWRQSDNYKKYKRKKLVEKYGENWSKIVSDMGFETRRRNGTLNSSSQEENVYKFLLKTFRKKDIIREYSKDERYPYHCDFYIKSKDLFIECNFHWTHGEHKYNPRNKKDKELALSLLNSDSDYKKQAHYVWTKLDPLKFKTAKKNNLKYLAFYKEKELYDYFKEGYRE